LLSRKVGDVVRDAVSTGVAMVIEQLPLAPEALALEKFLDDLYKEKLIRHSEVVRQVEKLLEIIRNDPEQRKRLIEIRKEFCSKREAFKTLADFFEEAASIPQIEDMAIANYAVIKVLLAQCEPWWEALDTSKKAEILAPLYMALYHLKMYRGTSDPRHLRSAATLAIEALNALEESQRGE